MRPNASESPPVSERTAFDAVPAPLRPMRMLFSAPIEPTDLMMGQPPPNPAMYDSPKTTLSSNTISQPLTINDEPSFIVTGPDPRAPSLYMYSCPSTIVVPPV